MRNVHRELVGTFTDARLFMMTQRSLHPTGGRYEAELAAMEIEAMADDALPLGAKRTQTVSSARQVRDVGEADQDRDPLRGLRKE